MIVAVVGPTAVGKSSLALALAEQLAAAGRPAEIVNADSMLLYRGMDIGTAKPGPEELARVPHHLVDVLDVTQTATVAEFQALARAAIAGCQARGVIPVLVGGSALYVRAVLDDFQFPGTDPALRARLEAELAEIGPEPLHARLAGLDPVAAAAILPGNARRVVRALEVIALTGKPFAASLPERRYLLADVRQVGLDLDRRSLDARIAERVDAMWAAGFVSEVESLVERGLRDGLTASRGLGYAQILRFLDGELSEEQARAETITGTRKFARRQDSWFRRDERIAWFDTRRSDLEGAVLDHLGAQGAGPGAHRATHGRLSAMRRWSFAKGHGTENDFVLLLDREGVLELGEDEVRFLCDRHAGIGADGVLRVVLSSHLPEWPAIAERTGASTDRPLWFMDYRNADGSIAEMCGNGVRVFARFLLDEGLASGHEIEVATRAGVKPVTVLPDGSVRVGMGPVALTGSDVEVTTADGRTYPATAADVGNPHAVSFVADPAELAGLALWTAPRWAPSATFPDGVNQEFVAVLDDRHVAMRVYERGSGETRSCGTGTVAVAAATRARSGAADDGPAVYRVDVPGGTVEVELADGQAYLTGPAVIVAHGEIAVPSARRHAAHHTTLED